MKNNNVLWPQVSSLAPAQQHVINTALARRHQVIETYPRAGATTCALALAAQFATQFNIELGQVAILTPTRQRADRMDQSPYRSQIALPRPIRTPLSLAYDILRRWSTQRKVPRPVPTLATGAEEDAAIARLIARHERELVDVLPTEALERDAFRTEVRNLVARCGEYRVSADQLAELGQRHHIRAWQCLAGLVREYEAEGHYDSARLQDAAVQVLRGWDKDPQVTAGPPEFSLVIVDDFQDMTMASARLVKELAQQGATICAFTCPEQAVETYRGARPHGGADLAAFLGVSVKRWQKGEVCPPPEPERTVRLFANTYDQSSNLAWMFKRSHFREGVPYDQMAVIVRDSSRVEEQARNLASLGIPVDARTRAVIMARTPGVRPIIDAAYLAHLLPRAAACVDDAATSSIRNAGDITREAEEHRDGVPEISEQQSEALIRSFFSSAYIGMNDLDARRLLRRIAYEETDEQKRSEILRAGYHAFRDIIADLHRAEAFEKAMGEPLKASARCLVRAARMIQAAREFPNCSPQDGLWEVWKAAGVADNWKKRALHNPAESTIFHGYLDAVVALMRGADMWQQRRPHDSAWDYITALARQTVPTDNVAIAGQQPKGVAIVTATAAAGRSFHTVAIADVNDGVWPHMRLRDSIAEAPLLADICEGRDIVQSNNVVMRDQGSVRAEVRVNEERLFTSARTRATHHMLISGVDDGGGLPSRFLAGEYRRLEAQQRRAHHQEAQASASYEEVREGEGEETPLSVSESFPRPTLRSLVARMRRQLLTAEEGSSEWERACDVLAYVAREGYAPAHPREWTGMGGAEGVEEAWLTQDSPLALPGEEVGVSASSMELALTCPLRWLLTRNGGDTGASVGQALGILIHDLAARWDGEDIETVQANLIERWHEVEGQETWRQRLDLAEATKAVRRLVCFLQGRKNLSLTEKEITHLLKEKSVDGRDIRGIIRRGRIDRIEAGDDGPLIIDFKTGKSALGTTDAAINPQLLLYQLAIEEIAESYKGKIKPDDIFGEIVTHIKKGDAGKKEDADKKDDVGKKKKNEISSGAMLLYLRTRKRLATERGQKSLEHEVPEDARKTIDADLVQQLRLDEPGGMRRYTQHLVSEAIGVIGGKDFIACANSRCSTCPVATSCPLRPEGRRTL